MAEDKLEGEDYENLSLFDRHLPSNVTIIIIICRRPSLRLWTQVSATLGIPLEIPISLSFADFRSAAGILVSQPAPLLLENQSADCFFIFQLFREPKKPSTIYNMAHAHRARPLRRFIKRVLLSQVGHFIGKSLPLRRLGPLHNWSCAVHYCFNVQRSQSSLTPA